MNTVAGTLAFAVAVASSPTRAEPALLSLPVRGHHAAVYLAPRSTERAPVLVVLHGNGDRAESICPVFHKIVDGRSWVVCPRGAPHTGLPPADDRWTYPGPPEVADEIAGALSALAAAHPGRIRSGPPVVAGFSLGAYHASRLAADHPRAYPRVFAFEGGLGVWTQAAVRRFASRGGQAAVIACGSPASCARSAPVCAALRREQLPCTCLALPGLGHTYADPFSEGALAALRALLPVEGH